MIKIKRQFIPEHRTAQRPGLSLMLNFITIHSTGNPKSTAKNEADYVCKNSDRSASYHFVCDDREIIQVLPINEVAWHAGDGRNGAGNRQSIAIEICESGNRKKAVDNAIDLTRWLMKETGIDHINVVQHYYWTEKNCPRILRDPDQIKDNINWAYFMDGIRQTEPAKEAQPVTKEKIYNSVEDFTGDWKPAIQWAIDSGICKGNGSGLALTRAEAKALVFLYRYHREVKEC